MTLRLRIVVPVLAGVLLLAGVGMGLLFVLPALALLALVAVGYLPGERQIEAARRRRSERAVRQRRAVAVARPQPVRVLIARGSALLACGLAVRPPPALRAAN